MSFKISKRSIYYIAVIGIVGVVITTTILVGSWRSSKPKNITDQQSTNVDTEETNTQDLSEIGLYQRVQNDGLDEVEVTTQVLSQLAALARGEKVENSYGIDDHDIHGVRASSGWILETTQDQALKSRIQADYDLVFGVPEVAAKQIARKNHSTFDRINPFTITVAAQPGCNGFTYDSACTETVDFESNGYQHEIIYNKQVPDYANMTSYIQEATEASYQAYETLGLLDIGPTIYLVKNVQYPGWPNTTFSADMWTDGSGTNRCLIDIWAPAQPLAQYDVDAFMQSIAHEYFHCHQTRSFKAQSFAAPYSVVDWWKEGTAEYFSEMVYPDVNYEHRFLASFDFLSPRTSIFNMTYHNYIFFRYVGIKFGDTGVLEFIRALPTGGDLKTQQITVSGYPNMQEFFAGFASSYLQTVITDRSGPALPTLPQGDTEYTINAVGDYIFNVEPFVVGRGRLNMEPGAEVYELTLSEGGTPGIFQTNKRQEGGGFTNWQRTVPAVIGVVSCSDEQNSVYRTAITSTKPTSDLYEVTIRATASGEYETYADEDLLLEDLRLYGQWKLVDGEIQRTKDQILDQYPALAATYGLDIETDFESIESSDSLCFFDKNLMISELNEIYQWSFEIEGQQFTYRTTSASKQRSRYTIDGSKILLIQPNVTVTGETVATFPGGRQVFPVINEPSDGQIEITYNISGPQNNELDITFPLPPFPQAKFKKVG